MRSYRFAAHLVQFHGAKPASGAKPRQSRTGSKDSCLLRSVDATAAPASRGTYPDLDASRGVIVGLFGGIACWAAIAGLVQLVRVVWSLF